MARVVTSDELNLLRAAGDFSRLRLAIHVPNTIYTARVNGAPASNDMVNQIQYDGGTGDLADIHDEMLMYVGSTAGARDKGIVRLRKAPDADTFFFGETSVIRWADNDHLTVVDAFAIRERPVRVVAGETLMDSDVEYDDQHVDFDPVPVLGPHIVMEMPGADVDVMLGPPADTASWVFDGTIDSVEWVIPDATAIDDDTAINPVVTFDTPGWHACYCTITADNGKSFEGVRYVYIWNADNPPVRNFKIVEDPQVSYEDGGWSCEIEMYDEAHLDEVIDGALVILFAEDYYDGTKQSLGPVEGRENIKVIGWIAGRENIDWNPETGGGVRFTIQGPHYWLRNNTKYGLDLSFATDTPETWNVMPNLTVDRAVWHILHWRSNVTKLMDVTLTGDERMTTKAKTPADSLWGQVTDLAFNKIFARPGCDRYARLWLEIDPQMVPEAGRDWAVVQTITKKDWSDTIEAERRKETELCILFTSGEVVGGSGSSNTLYSLAPGHVPLPEGGSDIVSDLLVSDQDQANEQAGLLMGWRNNELPDMQIKLAENNGMIDLFPRQFLYISITEGDTPRGLTYDGNIIPRSMAMRVNGDDGTISTELTCEAETFPYPSMNGDVPASAGRDGFDFSVPSLPGLPPMPDLSYLTYPDATKANANHPKVVVHWTSTHGVFYTTNFDADPDVDPEDKVEWIAMNNGLSPTDIVDIYNLIITPSGALYLQTNTGEALWRAASLGATWHKLVDSNDSEFQYGIGGIGVNPHVPDTIAIVGLGTAVGVPGTFRIFTGGVISGSASAPFRSEKVAINYNNNGSNSWYVVGSHMGLFTTPWLAIYSASGSLIGDATINTAGGQDNAKRFISKYNLPDIVFQWDASGAGGYNFITDDGATVTRSTDISPAMNNNGMAFSPTGTHAMGADQDVLIVPHKTTDGGATWSSVVATTPVGSDIWENCRDNFRWIRGGGIVISLTVDQGDNWIDKSGNLGYIAPLCDIVGIRYIS